MALQTLQTFQHYKARATVSKRPLLLLALAHTCFPEYERIRQIINILQNVRNDGRPLTLEKDVCMVLLFELYRTSSNLNSCEGCLGMYQTSSNLNSCEGFLGMYRKSSNLNSCESCLGKYRTSSTVYKLEVCLGKYRMSSKSSKCEA